MNYFYAPQILDGADFLDEEESTHCVKVLRYKAGDQIGLLDGNGGKYLAAIRQPHPFKTTFDIKDKSSSIRPPYSIHLAVAPTKNADRMEWLAEKITEIGVDQITLFFSQNSERRKYRTDRLEKKITGALKQSRNPFKPGLNQAIMFSDLLNLDADQKLIAFADTENPDTLAGLAEKNKSTLILIGPEGDFTKEEIAAAVKAGFKKISLGKNILRTETAALIACHTIHLINS